MAHHWLTANTREDFLRYVRRPPRTGSRLPALEKCPVVSVVIPNWNTREHIERCLVALKQSTYPQFEVIVVDNGSTDGCLDLGRHAWHEARFLCNSSNLGFSRACNQGYHAAQGGVIIFLNADTQVEPGWIEPLVSVMQSDPSVALAGSRLLLPDEVNIQADAPLMLPNGLAFDPNYGNPPASEEESVCTALYATGAALAARREFLELFGGFDEGYSPIYFEDVDLAFRAYRLGLKTVIVRSSRVLHFESHAMGKATHRYCYLYHRGRFRCMLLHLKTTALLNSWPRSERYWYRTHGRNLQPQALLEAYGHTASVLPRILLERFRLARKIKAIARRFQEAERIL